MFKEGEHQEPDPKTGLGVTPVTVLGRLVSRVCLLVVRLGGQGRFFGNRFTWHRASHGIALWICGDCADGAATVETRETIGAGILVELLAVTGAQERAASQKGIRGCKERHLKRADQPNQALMITEQEVDDWPLYV